MGSVKNFSVDQPAASTSLGEGSFVFTDDYSVFDWGKMPDEIEDKGKSLCMMGAYNFELLEEEGIRTHYRGVVEDERIKSLDELNGPVDTMAISLTQVPDLPFTGGEYDYDSFHASGGDNYLIPLEIVFRNSVPEGSSLRRRREPREVGLDYDEWPDESVELEEPIVEFSTKFEEKDRYIDDKTAREISGLGDDFEKLRGIAEEVNRVITQRADEVGLSHEDGKIECLYFEGEILVADVVGTFDENRFLYDGEQISKEFIRQYYKSYDPEWVDAVKKAKGEADEKEIADWKSLCEVSPKPLPEDVLETAGEIYASGANLYMGEEWFDTPHIDDVVEKVRQKRAVFQR